MPLSLVEWAMGQKEPLKKGVMLGITQESVVGDILDFRSTNSLRETGLRYDTVITPDFIPIDGTIPERSAKGKQLAWGVYEMAVHIDIPVILERAEAVERPSTRQQMLAVKGAAYKLNDQFVNGDQATDPNGFDGIEKIIGNLASAQTVGATEIDISGAPTSAVMHSFMDRVDDAIQAIEGHKPTFGLCNDTFGSRFRSVLRREGLLGDNHDWVRNGFPFGTMRQTQRTATTEPLFVYQGIPFYDIGLKADQSTRVITNAYAEGGSSAATRAYLVKLGEDDVEGLQFSPPDMVNIGLLENKNNERWRYTHRVGLAVWGPRSLVKIAGVKVA